MLTNVFRAMINNPFKESFYKKRKKKKKAINVFDNFFYFQAIEVSLFLRKLLASPGQ